MTPTPSQYQPRDMAAWNKALDVVVKAWREAYDIKYKRVRMDV